MTKLKFLGCGILLLGAIYSTEVAWSYYKKLIKNPNKKKKSMNLDRESIVDVMFFSDDCSQCRTHSNNVRPCSKSTCPIKYLNKLMFYLSTAKKTIDVCVYFLTINSVVKLLKELHLEKDIEIRVITDDESTENDASQIFNLRKSGIKVRTKKSLYLMHHKFAIVDKKLLITGSANWTIQAFFGNCENIIVLNEPGLVKSFLQEYERLWSKYDIDYSTELELMEKMEKEKSESLIYKDRKLLDHCA